MIIARDINGEDYKIDLLDIIAHELVHITQVDNVPENSHYKTMFALMEKQQVLELEKQRAVAFNKYIPENYALLSDEQKAVFLTELYEKGDCPKLISEIEKKCWDDFHSAFQEDRKMAGYIQRVETPAIDFANKITAFSNEKYGTKYQQRVNDYSDGIPKYKDDYFIAQEAFMQNAKPYMNVITKNGGIDKAIEGLEKHYEILMQPFRSGALVRHRKQWWRKLSSKEKLWGKINSQNLIIAEIKRCNFTIVANHVIFVYIGIIQHERNKHCAALTKSSNPFNVMTLMHPLN